MRKVKSMVWQRASECLMCGKDRCLENGDEPGVGYCFRNNTMHRNGRPFIKKGTRLKKRSEAKKPSGQTWTVFGKGEGAGSGEGKGEKAVCEKGCPPSPPQIKQIEFGFEE